MKVKTIEEFHKLNNVLTTAYIGLAKMCEDEANGTVFPVSSETMDESLQEIGLLLAEYQRKYVGA